MKRCILSGAIILLAAAAAKKATAETYRIGPQREVKSLSLIASKLKPGDVVEIDPGVYREALRLTAGGTREAPITIRGVGPDRPLFDAEALDVSGRGSIPRGILEIAGAYCVVEHLEFKNARNGNNGAGIRLLDSTNAVIRDCKVTYCDMGIFGGDRETATIEGCEIAFNGTAEYNGYSHNFYMHGNRVVVRNCHIHDSLYGQNFKSRAHYNELWYNWIADSNEGEVGPVDGRGATDRPNSNVLLVGNVIISKPDRKGNSAKFILLGSELGGSHDGTLYLFHNTLIAGSTRIIFVQLDDPKARAVMHNNIFYGSQRLLGASRKPISVEAKHNWIPAGAAVPDGFVGSMSGETPGFVDPANRDYRLTLGSVCVNNGLGNLKYIDGEGTTQPLRLERCYLPHRRLLPRLADGRPDLGAHELGVSFGQ